jgi:hypothetical protein
MMDKQDELRMINYNSDARLGAKYSVPVYRTVCCSYDHVCVPLCDGKVTIFKCGEEKHKLGVQNGNQAHVLLLITNGILFQGN